MKLLQMPSGAALHGIYIERAIEVSYPRGDEKTIDADTLQLVMGLTPEEVALLTHYNPTTHLNKKLPKKQKQLIGN